MTAAVSRTAAIAIAALAVMVIEIVLPPHGAERIAEPFELELGYYALALVLQVITVIAAVRRVTPGMIAIVLAHVAIAIGALPSAVMVYFTFAEEFHPIGIAAIAVLVAAIAFAVLAWLRRGWARWTCLLAAFACVALPYGCPRIMGVFNVWSGGWVFTAGATTLIVLGVVAVLRRPS
jgi:hypothetical protein